MINITIKGPDLSKYIDDLTWSQVPYAMSVAMNKLGQMIGAKLVQVAGTKFTIRSQWSRRYKTGSVGAGPQYVTDAAAYFSTQISKKVPLADMKIKIATPSWQVAQQTDDTSSSRTPEYVTLQNDRGNKIKYIAIPIMDNVKYGTNGKLQPNAQHLLNNPIKNRIFVLQGKANGKQVVFQRYGSGPHDYRALYVLVEAVQINPQFNFAQVVEDTVNRMFDELFDRAMTEAMATAKV